MLDGVLKSKFYTKCKTNLKLVKTRVETTKKKKNAVQKFLKNDIADLLRNGLDIDAYNRAEGFLIEKNMRACYELIENFCGCISSNLSLMQKQRECPEECREAVSSLNYAAARFADLPELRDLRNVFTERFGNSLDCYTSKEFLERLRQKDFTKEMKLQLLEDIAKEFSTEWDSKALEQKLFTPPPVQNQSRLSNNDDESYRSQKSNEAAFGGRNTQDPANKPRNLKNFTASEEGEIDHTSRHNKNVSREKYKVQSSSEDDTITDFSQDERKTSSSSAGSVSEDDADGKRPVYQRLIRPPYLKPKPVRNLEEPPKKNEHVDQVEAKNLQDNPVEEDKPKPRSVRRRNLKPPPGYDENSSGTKQEARQALRDMNNGDQMDEKEKMIDGLLMHYSNKRSPYEYGESDTSRLNRSRKAELVMPPGRMSSLPPEPMPPEVPNRGHARAVSLQPEMLSAACHVHPKLPADYDELAARIAALRGK